MEPSSSRLLRRHACTLVCVFVLLAIALPAGPVGEASAGAALPGNVRMVLDINQASQVNVDSPLVPLGDHFYFAGYNDEYGTELWRCKEDGTNFELVKDIYPGPGHSSPYSLTLFKGALYFTAIHPDTGRELWKSDGTSGGTVLVKDMLPGKNGQLNMPGRELTPVTLVEGAIERHYLFFPADGGATGTELWKTDGTPEGTVQVKDIFPGASGSAPGSITVYQNEVYFAAWSPETGYELWKTDGTEAGTEMVIDLYPGYSGANPGNLTVLPVDHGSSLLIFSAQNQWGDQELFQYDGATFLQVEIYPGNTGSYPDRFMLMNGSLFFAATDDTAGRQIWKYTGNGAPTRVTNINLPAGAGQPRPLAVAWLPEGKLLGRNWLFFAASDAEHGEELWKTDGAVTQLVADIHTGPESSRIDDMVVMGEQVFFRADDGVSGSELWASTGEISIRHATRLVKDLLPGSASGQPEHLLVHQGRLLFISQNTFFDCIPWISDGTAAGTYPLDPTVPGNDSSDLVEPAVLGNRVIFPALTVQAGQEPWVSDGKPGGTKMLKDIFAGAYGSYPGEFTRLNDRVLFRAYHPDSGYELWSTDGTAAGTQLLADLKPGPDSAYPSEITVVKGIAGGAGPEKELAFFTTREAVNRTALWRSDGTPAGTRRIDILPDPILWVANLYAAPGMLYMVATTSPGVSPPEAPFPDDLELWKSDGTPAGTQRVKDIYPGSGSSNIEDMLYANGWLYFEADDGLNGRELWKSDGSEANTRLIRDINAGSSDSYIGEFTLLGDKVYFHAYHSDYGFELWKTDGSTTGTSMVKDINPHEGDGFPQELFVLGSYLYFSANDGEHGEELWRSDGSGAGTTLVKDIYPGPESSYPESMTGFANHLYFRACDQEHGCELWETTGASENTHLVADIQPGPGHSWPEYFRWTGNRVFFAADDGVHGYELWLMDVTLKMYLPHITR